MTEEDFYTYFYKAYGMFPFAAQLKKQAHMIAHLNMEVGKLHKQLRALSQKKEG